MEIRVHIAVLVIAKDPSRADRASGDAISKKAAAAGHSIVARMIAGDREADIRRQLEVWIADREIDVVIVAADTDTEHATAAMKPLVNEAVPGFTDLFRWLAFQEIGASAMLSSAEAARCGTTFVFVLPAVVGAVAAAMDKLILPQLDVKTTPKNLIAQMPRLQMQAAMAMAASPESIVASEAGPESIEADVEQAVPRAVTMERTESGPGLSPRLPAANVVRKEAATPAGAGRQPHVVRKEATAPQPAPPPREEATRIISADQLEKNIQQSNQHDAPTRVSVEIAKLLPRRPPGADDDDDASAGRGEDFADLISPQPFAKAKPKTPSAGAPAVQRKPAVVQVPGRIKPPSGAPVGLLKKDESGRVVIPTKDAAAAAAARREEPTRMELPPKREKPREPSAVIPLAKLASAVAADDHAREIDEAPTVPRKPAAPLHLDDEPPTKNSRAVTPAKPLPSVKAPVAPATPAKSATATPPTPIPVVKQPPALTPVKESGPIAPKIATPPAGVPIAKAAAAVPVEIEPGASGSRPMTIDESQLEEITEPPPKPRQTVATPPPLPVITLGEKDQKDKVDTKPVPKLEPAALAIAPAADEPKAIANPRTRPPTPPPMPALSPLEELRKRTREPTPMPLLAKRADDGELPEGKLDFNVKSSGAGKKIALFLLFAVIAAAGGVAFVKFVLDKPEQPKRDVANNAVVAIDAAVAQVAPPTPDASEIDMSGSGSSQAQIETPPPPPPPTPTPPGAHRDHGPHVGGHTPTPPPPTPPTPPTPTPPTPDTHTTSTPTPPTPPTPDTHTPPPEDGCDEVGCVMSHYEKACCAHFKPADDANFHPHDGLDKVQVREAMEQVKPRVIACGEQNAAKGLVTIAINVGPDGVVHGASVVASPLPALGQCVAAAVKEAQFPKTAKGGQFNYPFQF